MNVIRYLNIRILASVLMLSIATAAVVGWVLVKRMKSGMPPLKKKSGADRWTQARRQQEDSEQIHSAGVDTCEARLENVRHLYEAGILDEDEYRQRVARIKSKHEE